MKLSVKKSGEGVLEVADRLTIERAEELKHKLLKSMKSVDILTLDMNNVTDIDLSSIQLFCSANRTFYAENKQLLIQDYGSLEVLNKVLGDAGFGVSHCMSKKYCKICLWEEAMQDDKNDNGSR